MILCAVLWVIQWFTHDRDFASAHSIKYLPDEMRQQEGTHKANRMEANRPRSQQASRKGKKAWRKNVDIEDVERGLHEGREKKRLLGDDALEDFVIDTKGDKELKSKKVKTLKSTEILSNKSRIAPLEVERNHKQIQGVKKAEVHRLMKLSGRVLGESKIKARVEKDVLVRGDSEDVWADAAEESIPEVLQTRSSKDYTPAKHAPKTLKKNPISVEEADNTIDAGKSYNPSLEEWKKHINKEYDIEYQRDVKHQELIDFQNRLKALVSKIDLDEESDSEREDEEQQEDEETGDYSLSINRPTKVKIKTKQDRNKQARHKERLELERKVKELRDQIHQLEKLSDINEEVSKKQDLKIPKKSKKSKKLFKYSAVQKPLEVKLSDELTNNLRNVKPEGNLFYDQMHALQASGKVESRIPVAKRRKYTPKITEKWTYKDFK